MNYQVKLIQAARKKGLDPSKLTKGQVQQLAIEVRKPLEVLRDARAAVASRVGQAVGLRKSVSLPVVQQNENICRTNGKCGAFMQTTDKEPVCQRCSCVGKWLQAKWADATQACPFIDPETGKPLWDNTLVEAA